MAVERAGTTSSLHAFTARRPGAVVGPRRVLFYWERKTHPHRCDRAPLSSFFDCLGIACLIANSRVSRLQSDRRAFSFDTPSPWPFSTVEAQTIVNTNFSTPSPGTLSSRQQHKTTKIIEAAGRRRFGCELLPPPRGPVFPRRGARRSCSSTLLSCIVSE